jgi:hypothetical protein
MSRIRPGTRRRPPHRPATAGRLAGRFVLGLYYFAAAALVLSGLTGIAFWRLLAALLPAALACGLLILAMLARWALRPDGRLRQFGLGTALRAMALFAAFFAFVRWLVVAGDSRLMAELPEGAPFLLLAGVCAILVVLAVPFVLGMLEALVWAAAWLVRRRAFRRMLVRRDTRRSGTG